MIVHHRAMWSPNCAVEDSRAGKKTSLSPPTTQLQRALLGDRALAWALLWYQIWRGQNFCRGRRSMQSLQP
ncbi:hypothetical protein P8C59_001293 [Phyllachora maydis]|uniref:Uncharacterized protein n=1 Tax=Phyllachora maydis TaxID=1825666 RepID=A0AAD9MA19_9PEZI|nr:hypothetical protein P8C59_001293 [Phyllachora maydis]